MCRPLKDIVDELIKKHSDKPLFFDIEERSRIIADFDKNISYLFSSFKKYEEDVKFVLEHNLDVNIISRSTLNLTLVMQHLCESVSEYDYVIELYLMDDCYEKNRDLWSAFIDARQQMNSLFAKLMENNIFEVGTPSDSDVLKRMYYDDAVYNNNEKLSTTGIMQLNREQVDEMNGAELLICLDCLFQIFEDNLWELKNSAINRWEEGMESYYERNYLLYAIKYWPTQANNFRSHITRQRLRGKVDAIGLERLRQEAAHEFEYNTPSGKIWRDYSEDVTQMAIQMKEQRLDEKQWKYYFQRIFELEEYDRWIEELRNPPESDEDKQKRERLLKTNKVFNLEPSKSNYKVDILLLYYFIRDRFITEKMFVYEWYALYYSLRKFGVLTNCTTEDFVEQMNDEEWFANVNKKCSANEINTYNTFLTERSPESWDVKCKPEGNRASKNSIDNLIRKYSDLENTIDEIYIKE